MAGTSPAMTNDLRLAVFIPDQALDRNDMLFLRGREHDDALRRAAGDADAVDRAADQLPAVGDQHDLVGLLDRERGDQATSLFTNLLLALLPFHHGHCDNAFAAATCDPILVGRCAFAIAAF